MRARPSDTILCNKTNLIRALLGTPQEAKAIPLLEEILAEHSANEWCRFTLALCQIRLGKLAEARAGLEAMSPATRQSGQVQLIFADLAFAEKNPALALEFIQAAERTDTAHPLWLNNSGARTPTGAMGWRQHRLSKVTEGRTGKPGGIWWTGPRAS